MGNVTGAEKEKLVSESTKNKQTAAGTYFDAGLSEADKARVEAYRKMYYDAKERGDDSAMAAAHQAAEYIRAEYGYSGGADGSEYIPLKQTKQTAPVVPTYQKSTAIADQSAYLEQMYEAKKQSALAELKEAYDKSTARLDHAESGLSQQYGAARSAAAAAGDVERRNFAQYAAASGLNSGTAGQAELARSMALQNDINAIYGAEASARADLKLQRAQAESEYNAAIAQAEYTGEYELAAALYEEKVRVQQALIDEEIRQQQYALDAYKLEYQAGRDAVSDRQFSQEYAMELAAQALKEKTQADDLTLAQTEQALKQQAQAQETELAWAQLSQKEQQAMAEHMLDKLKYNDSRQDADKEQLAEYGEMYLKAGVMPPEEMRNAMGITAAEAGRYILALKTSQR